MLEVEKERELIAEATACVTSHEGDDALQKKLFYFYIKSDLNRCRHLTFFTLTAHVTGVPPRGWLSPWIAESRATPDLLAEVRALR